MHVAILNAGTGFHTDDLCRALTERGHTGRVLPYGAECQAMFFVSLGLTYC